MEVFGVVVVVLMLMNILDGYIANGTAKRIDDKEHSHAVLTNVHTHNGDYDYYH